ncbi:MAG: LysR family transcriptional regulator [Myxococcota bacterium]
MDAIIEDWGHLRDFLALTRDRTLSKAAESIRVDPSTIFRRVRALEEALGTTLFERRGRGYVLTATGESLAVRASQMEAQVLAIERDIAGRDQALDGAIRVTTTDTVALRLLAPHFRRFHEIHPSIRVDLSLDDRVFRLGRGEADVAIRPGSRPTEDDVVPREVSRVTSAFYASKEYVKRVGRPRRRSDLKAHTMIDLDESLAHVRYATYIRKLVPPSNVVFRCSTVLGEVMAVEQGLGVCLLPSFVVGDSADIVRLFPPEKEVESSLWLVVHRDLRHMARVRAFVDFMTEALTAQRDLLEGRLG